jgi:hypothetical protein
MPKKNGPSRVAPELRFWPKVNKTDGCWLWLAKVNNKGYGMIGRGGPGFVLAHRLSWEMANGKIPESACVLHTCDTPACVRPEHLRLGSHADNMRDMHEKERGKFIAHLGESNGQSKLTEVLVRAIRKAYAAGGVTQAQLAVQYGVSKALISFVVTRRSWRHVE